MSTVAKLDARGCLVGVEEVPEELPEGRVVVDPEIDLPLDGSYWWDADAQTFMALSQIAALVPAASPGPARLCRVPRSPGAGARAADSRRGAPSMSSWYEDTAQEGGGRAENRARAQHAVAAALRALVHGSRCRPWCVNTSSGMTGKNARERRARWLRSNAC